jgi:hypothetical protein
MSIRFRSENVNGTDYLRTTGMDGSLILKRTLKKRGMKLCKTENKCAKDGTDFI